MNWPALFYYELSLGNKQRSTPRQESIILKDIKVAINYSVEVLHERWDKLEEIIDDIDDIILYVRKHEKAGTWSGEWDKYERAKKIDIDELMNSPNKAEYLYKRAKINNKRLDKIYENIIKNDPQYAYLYTLNVIKDRWKDGEEAIIKNIDYLVKYINFLHTLNYKINIKLDIL